MTGQEVVDDAVARAGLNTVSGIADAILRRAITRYQHQAYLRAARVNPEFFGKTGATATRAAFTDSWNLATTPGDVAAVIKATVAAKVGTLTPTNHAVGAEVHLISGRTAWPLLKPAPRAYLRGRRITGYSTELGADSSNMITQLTLLYAELPTALAALGNSLALPDEWSDLVVIPLARFLALRDRRMDEVTTLDREYGEVLQNFELAINTYDVGLLKPIDSTPPRQPVGRQPSA